jgi:hypothetical protein
MIRHSLHLLAFGAAAALAGGGQAAADPCCGCPAPCAEEQIVEVVEARAPAPFYVVDQGPIYAGPGIVSFPTTYKKHQSIGAYPYIGHDYHRHPHHPEVVLWQQSRVAYVDVKAPHRMVMSGGHRMHRSAPRRTMRPPLDPRDK